MQGSGGAEGAGYRGAGLMSAGDTGLRGRVRLYASPTDNVWLKSCWSGNFKTYRTKCLVDFLTWFGYLCRYNNKAS